MSCIISWGSWMFSGAVAVCCEVAVFWTLRTSNPVGALNLLAHSLLEVMKKATIHLHKPTHGNVPPVHIPAENPGDQSPPCQDAASVVAGHWTSIAVSTIPKTIPYTGPRCSLTGSSRPLGAIDRAGLAPYMDTKTPRPKGRVGISDGFV